MTRNSEVLADFVAFCEANPDQRFWQALRNWADVRFMFVSRRDDWERDAGEVRQAASDAGLYDTFHWEGKAK